MVQYYRDMCPRRSHILAPMAEADSGYKGRKMLCNDALEYSFKGLKCMVSAKILLSHPYCTISFTVHNDASDKHLGSVISHNNKPISF